MHSPPYRIFVPKFTVDVIEGYCRVLGSFVGVVVAIERYVVHFIFFALGRLPVVLQKLLIFVVSDVLDVMDVKALFPGFVTVSSHVKSANKLFFQVLRHLL